MPRAKLPRRIGSETGIKASIARLRPTICEQLFRTNAIENALGVSPITQIARDTITEIVTIYKATYKFGTTPGETLRLLEKLRWQLRSLVAGQHLRHRDVKRRLEFLNRLVAPQRGTDQYLFDALSQTAGKLLEALKERLECQTIARELDELAMGWIRKLTDPEFNGASIRRGTELKSHLCGVLRRVWEAHSASVIRDSETHRRYFVATVLSAVDINYPGANDYQEFDGWIKTNVFQPTTTQIRT